MKYILSTTIAAAIHYALSCFIIYKIITPEVFLDWTSPERMIYLITFIAAIAIAIFVVLIINEKKEIAKGFSGLTWPDTFETDKKPW